MAAKIFHPLLSLIASATNNELARNVEFLKEENKILRARVPGQIHTKPDERSRPSPLALRHLRLYRDAITRARETLCIPRWTPHWLRHSVATRVRDEVWP